MRHEMNGFLIAVLIILIGSMIWGYWKGFIRIAFSLVAMILMIVLVSWATPYITDFLKENTTIYEDLAETCSRKIQISAEETIENKIEETGQHIENKANNGDAEAKNGIDGILLPEVWIEQILEKTGDTLNQVIEESELYHQAGEYMADWVLKGISFFAAFILVSIVLKFVIGMLDIVAKLPLIKGANRLLGGVAGLLQGLIIVWLLLFLVAIACTSQLGKTMLQYINDSAFLTYLYQHNGILYFFQYMFG